MQAFRDFMGQPNMNVAHQKGTVSSAAITLVSLLSGAALHASTQFVEISVENDDVRLTVQGTAPTSTLGERITDGSSKLLSLAEAQVAQVIRETTDAVVQIKQYIN
jgi:hypothetical protein